jgi:hypothetical protein
MKGKTAILGSAIILAIFTSTAWAGMSVPVSPGGGTEGTSQTCPTFSWSAAEHAAAYRLEVYEQVTEQVVPQEEMAAMAAPVVTREIYAPALSWTPSSGECLERGMHYVWYVLGVDAKGEGQWSQGVVFEVEPSALTVEQEEAVEDVVKNYLLGEGGASRQVKGSGVKVPLSYESGSNNFFGTGAGANTTGIFDTFIGGNAGYSNTTGNSNSFLGFDAGALNTTGNANVFVGSGAGYSNTMGFQNSFLGTLAGNSNTTGYFNSFLGYEAGYHNTTGYFNSFLGTAAGGLNTTGSGNVFLGFEAGLSETGSNKLYIDNCYTGTPCTQPLIYGEFDTRSLLLNGNVFVKGKSFPSFKVRRTVDFTDGGRGVAAFELTSMGNMVDGFGPSFEFWISDNGYVGAMGVVTMEGVREGADNSGKWILRTANGGVLGPRVTVNKLGYMGVGVLNPLYPIHMASGARVSTAGQWLDASSRAYKEDIQELTSSEALMVLEGLNPVTFRYKKDREEKQAGFIAEEVPELVATKERNSLSALEIVAVLTKVVKEQQRDIQEKDARIERLERALENMEKRLAAIENPIRTAALK